MTAGKHLTFSLVPSEATSVWSKAPAQVSRKKRLVITQQQIIYKSSTETLMLSKRVSSHHECLWSSSGLLKKYSHTWSVMYHAVQNMHRYKCESTVALMSFCFILLSFLVICWSDGTSTKLMRNCPISSPPINWKQLSERPHISNVCRTHQQRKWT